MVTVIQNSHVCNDNLYIFNDSLRYKQHIQKCIYIIYSIQKQLSTYWIRNLPPFLLRDIIKEYIVDPFTKGRFYTVIDNYNHTHPIYMLTRYQQRRQRERGIYYIGKIIDKQITNDDVRYLIMYKDWPISFNEWVSKKQLFHMKQNYIHTLRANMWLDCYCGTDNKWYRGIITKIHYTDPNKKNISKIDTIFWKKYTRTFVYRRHIPIYSNIFASLWIHTLYSTIMTWRRLQQVAQSFNTHYPIEQSTYIEFHTNYKIKYSVKFSINEVFI